jgi:hypothetical protein
MPGAIASQTGGAAFKNRGAIDKNGAATGDGGGAQFKFTETADKPGQCETICGKGGINISVTAQRLRMEF